MRPLRLVAFALVAFVTASLTIRTFARPPSGGGQDGPPGGGQNSGGPGGGGPGGGQVGGQGGPPPGFHLLPPFVQDKLNLTDDQQTQIDQLEKETEAKLEKILTPEQMKTLKQARPPRRAPGGQGGQPGGQSGGTSGGQGRGGQGGAQQGGSGGDQGGPPPPPQN